VLLNLNFLNFEKRFEAKKNNNIFFPYIIGLAFGFGWTPCIGPILGSILTLAAIEETLSKAVILLGLIFIGFSYSIYFIWSFDTEIFDIF
jgi:cytochrome c-type biogenesis protein